VLSKAVPLQFRSVLVVAGFEICSRFIGPLFRASCPSQIVSSPNRLLGSSSFMFLLFDDIQLADVSLFVLTGIPQIIPFSR